MNLSGIAVHLRIFMSKNRHSELVYRIALTQVQGIGPVKARKLVASCGSAEAVFREKKNILTKIPDIGQFSAQAIASADGFHRAEMEAEFIERNGIRTLFFTDEKYPERLLACEDSPILLFAKGEMNLNAPRVISVVGTRKATPYGRAFCEELIRDLVPYKPLVVSGLAYGIDICAHRYAIRYNLPTVGCLAHGMDRIYPSLHTTVAKEMVVNGGLLTEFLSGTAPDRELFPTRNRIIAGLADCTIIVESDLRGGSVITAQVANGYNRDVFAVPGRHNDRYSSGCNHLIRRNVAAILTSAEDLVNYMNWNSPVVKKNPQAELFDQLSGEERKLMELLSARGKMAMDTISESLGLGLSRSSSVLLSLEFQGYVKALPGKFYAPVSQ